MSADEMYARLVASAGLYAVAFYGERMTDRQRRRLAHLWRQARMTAWHNLERPTF